MHDLALDVADEASSLDILDELGREETIMGDLVVVDPGTGSALEAVDTCTVVLNETGPGLENSVGADFSREVAAAIAPAVDPVG